MRISDWSSDGCSSDLLAVLDVEFYQRLRVLGNESDRHHHDRLARARGLLDLAVGRRPDPLQRPDAALVADLPVEVHLAEPAQHRRHALLDLPLDRKSTRLNSSH